MWHSLLTLTLEKGRKRGYNTNGSKFGLFWKKGPLFRPTELNTDRIPSRLRYTSKEKLQPFYQVSYHVSHSNAIRESLIDILHYITARIAVLKALRNLEKLHTLQRL